MVLTTDHDGKAWIETQVGDITVRFAVGGDGGVTFGPYQQIEIDDARMQHLIETLMASFGAEAVPIEAA